MPCAFVCLSFQVPTVRLGAERAGFKVEMSDLPTIGRIVESCLAREAFARALLLRLPGAPAAH
jgi:hypothetical protein